MTLLEYFDMLSDSMFLHSASLAEQGVVVAALGESLRRERELRGISLEEVSAGTKIKVGFLEAIENEDLARLPGGIFARAFIRAYASYLSLDADQFIAQYQAAAQPKDYELSRLKSANRAASPDKPRPPALPFLVAAAMLIGAYSVFHYSHRSGEVRNTLPSAVPAAVPPPSASPAADLGTAAPAANTQPDVRKTGVGASGDEVDKKTSAPPGVPLATPSRGSAITPGGKATERRSLTGQASVAATEPPTGPATTSPGKASPATEPSSDRVSADVNQSRSAPANAATPQSDQGSDRSPHQELVLKLAVTEPVWVSVDADGKTSLQRVLSPNHVATVKARDSFDVTTGNAQAVTLTLNGLTLKPLGGKDEVKRVHLTQDDAKTPSALPSDGDHR